MDKIAFARIGAVCYVLWGLVHYDAVYNVYDIALGVPPNMVQGRLFQEAFYLFAFATTGIVLAITMNWRNSRAGFRAAALNPRRSRCTVHPVRACSRLRAVLARPLGTGAVDRRHDVHWRRPITSDSRADHVAEINFRRAVHESGIVMGLG